MQRSHGRARHKDRRGLDQAMPMRPSVLPPSSPCDEARQVSSDLAPGSVRPQETAHDVVRDERELAWDCRGDPPSPFREGRVPHQACLKANSRTPATPHRPSRRQDSVHVEPFAGWLSVQAARAEQSQFPSRAPRTHRAVRIEFPTEAAESTRTARLAGARGCSVSGHSRR